ncbi:MAG: hypothetical protein GXP32_01405 [Kiritimatiellaeota bacterium]|nr:hypothetical protein [Kiritimatiellota bacterium]
MSAVIIMTPVVIAAWPVISAAVVGAVGAMGYAAVNSNLVDGEIDIENSVDLEIANSEIAAENMSREEELLFTKGDITLTFKRDIRGKLKICVAGKNHSDNELRRIGTEISQKVTRQFIYNRIVSELKNADFSIVDQEVGENDAIKIQVRNWR